MPTTLPIATDDLPSATADVIRDLLEDLLARHPGLTGFQLAGSYWNPSSQLPEADIDLRRFGDVDPGDPRVSAWQVLFEHRGRLIDLAEWVFGDLRHPEALSLRDIVSFVRARILWERGSSLRDLSAILTDLLHEADWRHRRVDEAFQRCETRIAELIGAHQHIDSLRKSVSPLTDAGYFRHVFYTIVDQIAGLLSVLDFRPPSLARKAMLEIADCLSAMQLPNLTETIYDAVGCAEFDIAECRSWREELEAVYSRTAAFNAGALIKRNYHTNALEAMIRNGRHRAAVFPYWRGLEECRIACDLIPPPWLMPKAPPAIPDLGHYRELRDRIDADLEQLRIRLNFGNDAQIADRLAQSMTAVAALRSHRELFHAHFEQKVRLHC